MSKAPKNSTKTAALAAPDKAIRAHGEKLFAAIETVEAAQLRYKASAAPLDRTLEAIRRRNLEDQWEKMQTAQRQWGRTRAGRKNAKDYRAFCEADAEMRRTVRAILRCKPKSLAAFAIYAIAGLYSEQMDRGGEFAYGFGQITAALCRASGVRAPKAMERMVPSN